jgi:GAF domain-containing protein
LEESSAQIQKRASQLETIADVASSVATLQDVNELLPYITQIISERFDFYHAGIFLISDDREYAVLRAANSEGGQKMLARKHKLRVGKEGIVGFAVDQKRARIALDVGTDAVYFDNPDLPATRSEMALPLMIGENVIGVLDVQSEQSNAFSHEDIKVLSTLANQVAVAIENARLFQQSQEALKELDRTFQRYISSEWQQFAEQTKVIGYRANESGLEPITEAKGITNSNGSNGNVQKIPIKLRGTTLGSLNVDMGNRIREYSQEEENLISTIADRLALALESARLLEDSQKVAAKEQIIGQITGKIGSSINLRNVLQTAVEELGHAIPGSEIIIKLESDKK